MTKTLSSLGKNEGLSKTASTCDFHVRPAKFPFILEVPPSYPSFGFYSVFNNQVLSLGPFAEQSLKYELQRLKPPAANKQSEDGFF